MNHTANAPQGLPQGNTNNLSVGNANSKQQYNSHWSSMNTEGDLIQQLQSKIYNNKAQVVKENIN